MAVASWGLYDLTNRQLQMTVASARQNKDEKFLAIAFHYKGDVDFEDVSELQKSAPYDVRVGAQVMIFHYDEKFAAEWASGLRNTSYVLLIVPSTVRPEDFSTIRRLSPKELESRVAAQDHLRQVFSPAHLTKQPIRF